jgi:sulfite exporter TauE/SafE
VTNLQTVEQENEPFTKRLFDVGAIALVFAVVYYFISDANLIPAFNPTQLNYTGAFILGLIASTSTCMATSGALFLATIGKLQRKKIEENTSQGWQANIIPAVSFNVGRILSYAVFGFIMGIIGKTIAYDLRLGTFLDFFIAIILILVGLDMVKLLEFSSMLSMNSFKTRLFDYFESKLMKHPRQTAFFLGAITYLLPCGFTQTVQVSALGIADPLKSSLTMAAFAAGTVPLLMLVGSASSIIKSSYYPLFMKIVGVLVILIGFQYLGGALNKAGIRIVKMPWANQAEAATPNTLEDGYQVVKMNVTGHGYAPNVFTVKKDIPVKWIINGENIYGCQGTIVSQKIGLSKTLKSGENVVTFTPKEKGNITFTCSMGMFPGSFIVI